MVSTVAVCMFTTVMVYNSKDGMRLHKKDKFLFQIISLKAILSSMAGEYRRGSI